MLCNYRQVINFSDFSLSEWNSLSGPTHCNPMGYTVQGISQARILEWVAISLLWGNLPNLGIEPRSPMLWADSLPAEPNGKPETVVKILQFWGNLMAQLCCSWRFLFFKSNVLRLLVFPFEVFTDLNIKIKIFYVIYKVL